MFNKFIKHYLGTLLICSIFSLFIGSFLVFQYVSVGIFILIGLFFSIVAYVTYTTGIEEVQSDQLSKENANEAEKNELKKETEQAIRERNEFKESADIFKQSLLEKSSGFPTLIWLITQYEELRDGYLSDYLVNKRNPALKAAEAVKEESKRRRIAEAISKKTQAIIEYYESIAPFLSDFKEEVIEDDEITFSNFTEAEQADPVSNYLTKEEYRKLSSTEKNQMALDRFWKRPKSKWLIGRLYERYIGYLYENKGYEVDYHGIYKGLEDLGRDLICHKGKECLVIQCKNWSQFKTIHEKHIFQLFGTFFQYRDENPDKKAAAMFYTSTKLSDLARRFAKELDINLMENFKFEQEYPCIKCNIGKEGEKIYHLPFDQQYDNTHIEVNKGEFYCSTVMEAEKAGFRRAFRWHSNNE